MLRLLLRCVLQIALGLTPIAAACQGGSLKGVVRDKFEKTPIGGAQIYVSKNLAGISLGDGSYVVPIQKGGKLAVIYKQVGYVNQVYEVIVNGITTKDAELAKDTPDVAYWKQAVETIQARALGKQNDAAIYLDAWKDIDGVALSPEAKSAAAKQLWHVLPPSTKSPESLVAYQKIDPETLKDTEVHFDWVLTNSQKLTLGAGEVPAPVAADVAASQVSKFELERRLTVQQSFYSDFESKFGNNANLRLKKDVLTMEGAKTTQMMRAK